MHIKILTYVRMKFFNISDRSIAMTINVIEESPDNREHPVLIYLGIFGGKPRSKKVPQKTNRLAITAKVRVKA